MTNEQIEKERSAFEEWFGTPNGLIRDPKGNYVYSVARTCWNVWLAAKKHAKQSTWNDRNDHSEYFNEPEVVVQTEQGDVMTSEVYLEDGRMNFLCEEQLAPYVKVLYWQHLPDPKQLA